MRQAFHIFTKDVRRLWAPILIGLIATGVHVFYEIGPKRFGPLYSNGRFNLDAATLLMQLLAWWYLIIASIHQEPMVGDQHFWLTRPYARGSLLTAKVLFIVAFVHLPLLISDCVALNAQGFPAMEHLPGLLWRHVPFFVPLVLSAITIAFLTRNLWQFVLWPIGLVLIGMISELFDEGDQISGGSVPMGWIEDTVQQGAFALICCLIIWQQLQRRGWRVTIPLLVVAFLTTTISIPKPLLAKLENPSQRQPAVSVGFNSSKKPASVLQEALTKPNIQIDIPLVVSKLKGGQKIESRFATVRVGGEEFSEAATLNETAEGEYWESITIPSRFAGQQADAVRLEINPILTLMNIETVRRRLNFETIRLANDVACRWWGYATGFFELACPSALADPPLTRVRIGSPSWQLQNAGSGQFGNVSTAPFPGALRMNPVESSTPIYFGRDDVQKIEAHPGSELVFEIEHPAASFEMHIDCGLLRLKDYVRTAKD